MNITDDMENQDDFMKAMEEAEKKHQKEMKDKNVKPEDSHFECFGCGS